MATRRVDTLRPLPGLNYTGPRAAPSLPPLPKGWRGAWSSKPTLDPDRWKVGKAGSGPRKGKWVAKPVPRKPTAPAAPDPYAGHPDADLLRRFEGEPWAQSIIRQLRGEQTHHESYVADRVMPWQSGALTGLSQINQAAQQAFTGQVNAVAQGLAAASGAQPGLYTGTSGGAVTSPAAAQAAASAQGMAANASTMGQIAQWQQLMGTLGPTTYSQGQIAAMADYARGLPALYARKRQEAIDAIDKYITEREQAKAEAALDQARLEETMRANRVREATAAMNAQTNAAIAFGNLGIRASDSAARNAPEPVYADIPTGYVQLPNGEIVRDPTYESPSSSSSSGSGADRAPSPARGEYPPNKLRKEGFRPLPAGAGAKYRRVAVEATDGSLWYKPGSSSSSSSGSSGSSAPKPQSSADLISELRRLYRKGEDNGWEDRYDNDPAGAGREIALWVRQNKASFVVPGGGRRVDHQKLQQVLRTVGGDPMGHAIRILRGYITADGRSWK